MKRDLLKLAESNFDVVIIGGGIYGACLSWEAVLRGLSVALVERGDFGGETSSNSQRIIHGGFRYLQHADFKRMRESIRERTILMRIAPRWVRPLPVLIPTYGHGLRGKEMLALALKIYDLVSFDRNRGLALDKHIPGGKILSRTEVLKHLTGFPSEGLTGGAVFYDGTVEHSERLLMTFLESAARRGAVLANYMRVTGFVREPGRVAGVEVQDVLTHASFPVRARMVVNAAGPWVNRVLNLLDPAPSQGQVPLVKTVNLVTRPLFEKYAVGLYGKRRYHDRDAFLDKGARLFFITPWQNHSIVGTALSEYNDQDPDKLAVSCQDIERFLDEFNEACPEARLKLEDVTFIHRGFLPGPMGRRRGGDVQISKRYHIWDHGAQDLPGLISVMGVKYTTARDVAQKVMDRVFCAWGIKPPKSLSHVTPLEEGGIQGFEELFKGEICEDVLKAQALHAVREEMAQKLSDVILRRTELGSAARPAADLLKLCAQTMGKELGWSSKKMEAEIEEVEGMYPSFARSPL